MSPLVQTLIGAAAAIVGGLGGAIWQTRRADLVARGIRRAERREQGLLRLNSEIAAIIAELDPLYRQAERHDGAARPYQEALRLVSRLTLHWEKDSSGVIPDQDVFNAYAQVRGAVHDSGLTGSDFVRRMADLQAADPDAVNRFVKDLGRVLSLVWELKKVTQQHLDDLLESQSRSWPVLTRTRRLSGGSRLRSRSARLHR